MAAVCVGALWKGGREEQIAAVALMMSWAMTIALRDRSWIGTQWGAMVGDAGNLIALICIALTTRKYWPLFAAAFQLLCVVTHFGRMIDPHVQAWAYASAQVLWTQLLEIAIGVGAVNCWRRGGRAAQATTAPNPAAGATRR